MDNQDLPWAVTAALYEIIVVNDLEKYIETGTVPSLWWITTATIQKYIAKKSGMKVKYHMVFMILQYRRGRLEKHSKNKT